MSSAPENSQISSKSGNWPQRGPVTETGKGPSNPIGHKFTWANKRHKSSFVPKWCYCRNMALNKTWLPSLDYNYFHLSLYHLNAMGCRTVLASRAVKSEFFQFIFTELFWLEMPSKTTNPTIPPTLPVSPRATSTESLQEWGLQHCQGMTTLWWRNFSQCET